MTLQRRLLLYLLVLGPLVWAVALLFSVDRARHQVNELFDTEIIRLARQVQSTLRPGAVNGAATLPPAPAEGTQEAGESDVRDLAIAAWDRDGRLLLSDREGVQLPRRPEAVGFVDMQLHGEAWRVYYLQSFNGEWLVAAGQKAYERDELVFDLTAAQVAPWLLVLPLLLAAMAWGVRRALAPLHHLASELQRRDADDLRPISDGTGPAELRPMLTAMNGLFQRIESTLARERRFTADAAHELRTPLAVLRAQWDVVRHAQPPAERAAAEARFEAGLDRLDRLVTQMLALSRLEAGPAALPAEAAPVDWPAIVEQVVNDCLPLAERRRIELACDWPAAAPGREAAAPLPLRGDPNLLAVMLRNLVDNAVRYAPEGTAVTLRFGDDRLEVENDGAPLTPQQIQRLGERFHRPDGQTESGSGLGLSIVQRIAALHALSLAFGPRPDGRGMRVVVRAAGGGAPAGA